MKKLLRIVFLLLFLGVGFLYVIKNPELSIPKKILTTIGINIHTTKSTNIDLTNCLKYFDGCNTCSVSGNIIGGCTKLFCDTPTKPQCLEYVWTGMDLTNCKSYFDGCNNCTVKNGRPNVCTLMYCETPAEPKCNEYVTGTENTRTVEITNPATKFCIEKGGKSSIVESTEGQFGMCELADGTLCDERAYMRGECPTPIPNKACTQETKVCPNGSTVGRTGPHCEFALCPQEESIACTMEYVPVCALIQCSNTGCEPVQQTFSNRCMMNANKGAIFLHEGECGTSCRQLVPPAPTFCTDGIIIDRGKDEKGCPLPPICKK